MATLTRTDTADFKALTNCSVISGSVVPANWNFATDDTGTGNSDWDANCDVSTNAGYCTISNSTSATFRKSFCGATIASDFLLECAVDVTAFQGHTDQFGIIAQDGSGNIVICNLWRRDDSTWDVRLYTSGGTDVLVAENVGVDNGYLQLEKSGTTWTGRWGTDGSTFPSSNTATYNISGLSCGLFAYRSTQGAAGPATARFDYFSIESGFSDTATFEMDQFDAGLGNKIVWSTATDSSTGTPTIDYQYDQDGTDGFTPTYNGTWLTLAQLQALTDTLNRYTRIKGRLSTTDAADSYDQFTIDSAVADAIDPDLPTLSAAYYADGDSTKAVIIQVTHGDDDGAAGTYEGVNISYRNGGTWYYEQSDGTFDTDETFANLGFCGSANTVEWCALDGLPTAADRIGVKAWDSAGNSSARAESTPALLDFPAAQNVLETDTVGGSAGTLTLPAVGDVQSGVDYGVAGNGSTGTLAVPAEADVESGVTYGADGTEFTGTYDPEADNVYPDAGDVLTGSGAYGPTGADYTPSYSPDFPDVGNVTTDDTVNGSTGTFAVPAEEDVESGVTYGADGTEFTGTLVGGGSTPPSAAPGLSLADDETGSSFTATLSGVAETDDRVIRYRSVSEDVWTTTPASGSRSSGSGTVQVTGLSAGSYEVEAFAANAAGYGPTSVRRYVIVTDGTTSGASAVDTADLRMRLRSAGETGAIDSRNGAGASYDPTAETSVVETYDGHAGLLISAPRAVTERMVQSSGGRYQARDLYVDVLAEEVESCGVEPAVGDRFTRAATGHAYDIVGVDLSFNRAGYRLYLRSVS